MLMTLVRSTQKTVLVTGANRGLGYENALGLAAKNFKVIMVDKDDLTESKNRICEATGNDNLLEANADFTSLKSIRNLAQKLNDTEERLDVLLNNVGVFCLGRNRTCDGLQPTMQVNHFGPFLLTHLLEDLLKKSSPSRVIFTTSTGAFLNCLTPENLNNPDVSSVGFLSSLLVYYNSKLCNMITSKMFAEKFADFKVTCNCFHPGMTGTNFMVKTQPQFAFIPKLLLKNAAIGAQTGIFLASAPHLENCTGKFFVDFKEHQQPRILSDNKFCEEIWDLSRFYVNLK